MLLHVATLSGRGPRLDDAVLSWACGGSGRFQGRLSGAVSGKDEKEICQEAGTRDRRRFDLFQTGEASYHRNCVLLQGRVNVAGQINRKIEAADQTRARAELRSDPDIHSQL